MPPKTITAYLAGSGKKQHHVDDAVGKAHPVGQQDAVDGSRSPQGRSLIGKEVDHRDADAGADSGYQEVAPEFPASPVTLQFATEHEQDQHIDQQVKDAAMQEDVGKQLPEVESAEHQGRAEAEQGCERSAQPTRKDLHHEHHHAGDDDPLHHGSHGAPEGDGAGGVSIAVIHEITSRESAPAVRGYCNGFRRQCHSESAGRQGPAAPVSDWALMRSGGMWGTAIP